MMKLSGMMGVHAGTIERGGPISVLSASGVQVKLDPVNIFYLLSETSQAT